MRVAISVTASSGTPWVGITVPNTLAYCLRHGYTLLISCESYDAALASTRRIAHLLDHYDLVWTLDADCLITNHTLRIEAVPGLGAHASICEEGLGPHALVNGGSIVWRSTSLSRALVDEIAAAEPEWRPMTFNIQEWLMRNHERLRDRMTIMPKRAFNSVHYGEVNYWRPGDFVYHPCGAPPDSRCQMLRDRLASVVS